MKNFFVPTRYRKEPTYYVRGGIFCDTSFTKVEPGTEEEYGPFDSYEEALEEWKRRTFTGKLDICTHRMKIEEE